MTARRFNVTLELDQPLIDGVRRFIDELGAELRRAKGHAEREALLVEAVGHLAAQLIVRSAKAR